MYVYNILKNISPFGVGGKINETVESNHSGCRLCHTALALDEELAQGAAQRGQKNDHGSADRADSRHRCH